MGRYDVRCAGAGVKARTLSGGNLQKLVLARVLSRDPKLVVACQPTQGLDVGAASYVHEQLLAARSRGGGIILISEDLEELMALSDRIAVMFRGVLSEPIPRQEADLAEIGLLMSGHTKGVAHAS
jgi:simple sugar transport system ATP-binding protein